MTRGCLKGALFCLIACTPPLFCPAAATNKPGIKGAKELTFHGDDFDIFSLNMRRAILGTVMV